MMDTQHPCRMLAPRDVNAAIDAAYERQFTRADTINRAALHVIESARDWRGPEQLSKRRVPA